MRAGILLFVGKGGASIGDAVGLAEEGTVGVVVLMLRLLLLEGVGDTARVGLGWARAGVLPLSIATFVFFVGEGNFDGDKGAVGADDTVVDVNAVVLVVRTDLTDAADDAVAGGVVSAMADVRAIN